MQESILRRSLAEVLADPIPFPKLRKVDEPEQKTEEAKPGQAEEHACEAETSHQAHG